MSNSPTTLRRHGQDQQVATGYVTLAAGEGYQRVDHPLGAVPDFIILTPRGPGAPTGQVCATDVTSTQFDIAHYGNSPEAIRVDYLVGMGNPFHQA